ncbi:MAG: PQQ-binding-like beta-propeller repeat protein [Planctomycetia bacterium]|nr:PQQ-binding-like beta-propeller repeat protein [Planctomycetia bacterium]
MKWVSLLKVRFSGIALLAMLGLNPLESADALLAENWPQWRGAKHNGHSSETNTPTKWSKTENIAWRLPLPGPGGATPVVWGERIFLTSVDKASGDLLLMCVGTDGKEKWRQVMSSGNKDVRGDEGNSASNSPCTDGEHVWAMMANGVLGCYSVEGKEVWKLDLQDRYGKFSIQFGMTSSPLLDGGQLYLQLIHGEGNAKTREAVVVCVDQKTGKEVWKQDRPSDAIAECEHSYASPTMYDYGQSKFLLSHGADFIVAHDLSDGHELWRCGNLNVKSKYDPTLRFVATPVTSNGIVIVPTAKGAPLLALKPNGKGDITNNDDVHLWKHAKTPDVPSPLIHDGLVYLCMQDGQVHCLDEKSGEQVYLKRAHSDRYRSSPLYADGKIYLTARGGFVTVIKTGKSFEVLAENEIGEAMSASPAIANGTLFLRSFDALWAIRNK